MTSDEMARMLADQEKRLRVLEKDMEARNKVRHYPPPKGLDRTHERPGRSLGVDTSLGHYAEFNED